MAFGAYSTAMEFRRAVQDIAAEVINKLRPPDRYGVVSSIDYANGKAGVLLGSDPAPVSVNIGTISPTHAGQRVRVGGYGADKYITEAFENRAIVLPPSTNLNSVTTPGVYSVESPGGTRANGWPTEATTSGAGILTVYSDSAAGSNAYVIQEFTGSPLSSSVHKFMRSRSLNTWTPWMRVQDQLSPATYVRSATAVTTATRAPSWYFSNHPRETLTELMNASNIGLTGVGANVTVTTTVPSVVSSSGSVRQVAITNAGHIFSRTGTGTSATWTSWIRIGPYEPSTPDITRTLLSAQSGVTLGIPAPSIVRLNGVDYFEGEISYTASNVGWRGVLNLPSAFYPNRRILAGSVGSGGSTMKLEIMEGGTEVRAWTSSAGAHFGTIENLTHPVV